MMSSCRLLFVVCRLTFISCCLLVGSNLIVPRNSGAAAKPPVNQPPNACTNPGTSFGTPFPVRNVVLTPIGTKVFQLPNGVAVDLGADLQSMLITAVAQTAVFSPSDFSAANPAANPSNQPNPLGPCASWIELRSAVTSLQLNAGELSIAFGYSPSGSVSPVTAINAKVDVKIGTIAMDFSVWVCENGQCSAIAASTADHLTAGVNLSLEVDFSSITAGPNFVYNTPLGDTLRKIMIKGMSSLVTEAHLNDLPWQARVKEYIPAAGLLIFDAGTPARLSMNQGFEIYAPTNATSAGVCNVYQMVALAHSTAVGTASTSALVDQVMDTRGVQVGDVVMLHQNPSGH